MKIALQVLAFAVCAMVIGSAGYFLGYRQSLSRRSAGSENGDEVARILSLDASVPSVAIGDTLAVGAMEVAVRAERIASEKGDMVWTYGALCPLRDLDPVRVIALDEDIAILEVIPSTDDGRYQAGDRVEEVQCESGTARMVYRCPVGTPFAMPRGRLEKDAARYREDLRARELQDRIEGSERKRIDRLRDNRGVRP